jgi:hypothetical protein
MPQLIWFNPPTNHSGTVNFLFLNPDNEVGSFTLDAADGGGPYILGGPALYDYRGEITDAARTLISQMPRGIYFFPEGIEERVRQVIRKHENDISDGSSQICEEEWELQVYSHAYSTTQCCEALLRGTQPKAAIVCIDRGEDGEVLLAMELAKIYYGLSKAERTKLKLGPDWKHHWEE